MILIIAAIIWFTNSNKIKETKISDSFINAQILIKKGKKNEAEKILSNLVLEKNSPYSSLSLFLIIENKLIVNKETIINYPNANIVGLTLEAFADDSQIMKYKIVMHPT